MCRKLLRLVSYTIAVFCLLTVLGIGALQVASYPRGSHCKLGPGDMDLTPEGPSWYVLLSTFRGWAGATLTRHTPWRVWIPPNDRSAWPLPPEGVEISGLEPEIWRSGWPYIAVSRRFYFGTSSESQHKRWEAFRDMGDNSSVPLDLNNPLDGWVIAQQTSDIFWVPTHIRRVVHVYVCLPLWLLIVTAAAYPTWAMGTWLIKVRRHRKCRQAGLCQRCDYDQRGNTSATCPECGHPSEPSRAPAN